MDLNVQPQSQVTKTPVVDVKDEKPGVDEYVPPKKMPRPKFVPEIVAKKIDEDSGPAPALEPKPVVDPTTPPPAPKPIDDLPPARPVLHSDAVGSPKTPIDLPVDPPAAQPATSQPSKTTSQALEDQNIFYLLGVDDGTEDEREEFLDELQQIIWEDFMESYVELLITEEEMTGLEKVQDKADLKEEEKQEEMVVYLEKLVPDLEDIMLEKALELKEDMVRERIAGMKEYFVQKPDKIVQLDKAGSLIDDDKWRDAAELLNSMQE